VSEMMCECGEHSVALSVETEFASNGTLFYMVNMNHSVICRAGGYPPPAVYWQWQPCRGSITCTIPRRRWTSVSQSRNIIQVWTIIHTLISIQDRVTSYLLQCQYFMDWKCRN